jgi:hypothetical protein
MRLEDTPEYKRGRNGEILMHAFAIEHGCTAFDIGGTAHGSAPLLNSRHRNSIAPDALHIRNHPLWAEYKTKTNAFDWGGGSRDQEGRRMPPCLAHGIEARAYHDYKIANEQLPLVLWFLTLNTGMLHVGSLDELAEPFPSIDPAYPIVNWPISRMKRIASFDRRRVFQFVNRPPRERLPSLQERKDLLHWLRPVQVEFDGFIDHFLTVCERRWASRGTA